MARYSSIVIITVMIFTYTKGDRIPNDFSPCKKSNFDQDYCLARNAQAFVSYLGGGVPELNVPPSDPLPFQDFEFHQPNIDGSIANLKVFGLSTATVTSFTLDWVENKGHLAFNVPNLQITGDYVITGSLFNFTIVKEKGKLEIELVNTDITIDFDIELINGDVVEEYMNFVNPVTTFEIRDKATFNDPTRGIFDFLVNSILGLLSLGWRSFVNNYFPDFFTGVGERIIKNVNIYLGQVRIDELFVLL